ncbi:MAG: carbonic anhydrase family protein [bacterium]
MLRITLALVLGLFACRLPGGGDAPAAAAATPVRTPVRAEVQTSETQAAFTPASALERLETGNARFHANEMAGRDWPASVAATSAGQFPFASVLACMDSRAPVDIVFDQGLGDVFGVRVAGNVVNTDELGSLEYSVKVGTKLIVVLGHTDCGAVKGAIDDVKLGNLTGLLAKIHPAVLAAGCHDSKDPVCVNKVAEINVRNSIAEIRKQSPVLAGYLDSGKVRLVGGMYDVTTGKVRFLDETAPAEQVKR